MLILGGIFLTDGWNNHCSKQEVSHFWHTSKSIEESKSLGKYFGKYVYDSLLSESKRKDTIDKELWFEKVAYDYYKLGENGEVINFADSVFKDTVFCLPAHLTHVFESEGCSLTWIDKHKGDTIFFSYPGYINTLKHYPDTLLIIAKKDEPVYKGKICIVKE